MTKRSDPLDRLRAANPVPAGVATLPRPDPLLFARIVGEETTVEGFPPPHRRRARLLVPAFVVVSLLAGAVGYALLRGDVSKPQNVACFERADLESRTAVPGLDSEGPVAACAEVWRKGELGGGGEVPPLQECLLASGVAGVFPATEGDDVCARLNLGPVPSTAPPTTAQGPRPGSPPTEADVNARFLAFRDAVLPVFLDTPCMEPRAGAALVRRELAAAGLADWGVTGGQGLPSEGYSPQRPCASLAFHPERREIALIPSPPRP